MDRLNDGSFVCGDCFHDSDQLGKPEFVEFAQTLFSSSEAGINFVVECV